jgi:hypothetical protein
VKAGASGLTGSFAYQLARSSSFIAALGVLAFPAFYTARRGDYGNFGIYPRPRPRRGGGEIRASFPSYFIFRRACFTHSERVRDSRFNYATRFRHRRVQQSSARLDSFASFFMSRVKLSPRIFARHERRYDLVKERVLHSSSRRQKRMPKGRSLDGLPLRGWRMDSNSQG